MLTLENMNVRNHSYKCSLTRCIVFIAYIESKKVRNLVPLCFSSTHLLKLSYLFPAGTKRQSMWRGNDFFYLPICKLKKKSNALISCQKEINWTKHQFQFCVERGGREGAINNLKKILTEKYSWAKSPSERQQIKVATRRKYIFLYTSWSSYSFWLFLCRFY